RAGGAAAQRHGRPRPIDRGAWPGTPAPSLAAIVPAMSEDHPSWPVVSYTGVAGFNAGLAVRMSVQSMPHEPMNADLHCHSTVSDGLLSPADVARRAHANGVDLLALTDHDEVGGIDEAQAVAAELGL